MKRFVQRYGFIQSISFLKQRNKLDHFVSIKQDQLEVSGSYLSDPIPTTTTGESLKIIVALSRISDQAILDLHVF